MARVADQAYVHHYRSREAERSPGVAPDDAPRLEERGTLSLPKILVVGRTGAGKSSLIRRPPGTSWSGQRDLA